MVFGATVVDTDPVESDIFACSDPDPKIDTGTVLFRI
jgi:hypothetical protein